MKSAPSFAPRRMLWSPRLDRLDQRVTAVLAGVAVPALRVSMGLIFLWFGALKFVAGASPAEDIAARTFEVLSLGIVAPAVALPLLAAWEVAIGVGLISGRFLRLTLLLLALQMVGALAPLALFPDETWTRVPVAPTIEGQYIIKNVVLIAAAMVIGATVRGGRLLSEPAVQAPAPAGRDHTPEGA